MMFKYQFKKILYFLQRRNKSPRDDRKNLVGALGKQSVLGRHRMGLQIQTVSTCNATCYFCPYLESWHKDNPGVMSEQVYRDIIDQVSCYKVTKFCPYLENEPLLDPNIFNRIEYGLSRLDYLILELSTNAAHLDNKKLEDVLRIFPKVNHELRISFHGVDKESFESIMGLDFDRCLSNVLALIEALQNHNLKIKILGSGAPLLAESTAPKWFDEKKYMTFWDGIFLKQGFKKKPAVSYFKYHDRAGSIGRNEVNFSADFNRNLDGFYCHRIDQWLHFLYTGEVILCCMDYHKKTVFGDITQNTLAEIYKSDKYKEIASKAIGLTCSADNFICKKCISPGG